MKLTKQNVCVYIENEAQLQEARELLEKHMEEITEPDLGFCLTYDEGNYLRLMIVGWTLNVKQNKIQITLPELETILKEQ